MIIDDSDKARIKALFSQWLDVSDQRKQLNDTNKDLVKETCDILKVKAKTVGKLFRFLKDKHDNGDDDLDVIVDITESLT